MSYTELQPRPDLKPYVAAYWHFRVAEDAGEIEHSVPLTGGAILSTSKGPLMLTGPRMVEKDNEVGVLMTLMQQDIAPPSSLRADIPPALDAIVKKAMRNPNT